MNHVSLRFAAGLASVCTAATLLLFKAVWWQRSGSVSLLASAVDSALDLLSSGVILAALIASARPADNEHRYGHGKAEALAGFLQSLLIFGSAGFVIFRAIRGRLLPQPLANLEGGMIVMGGSLVLTAALVTFQGYVARRTESIAVKADRLHYVSDLAANGIVIVALLVERRFQIGWADFGGGVLTAAYIMKISYQVFRESFDILMDRDVSHLYRATIQAFIDKKGGVLGYHDLRSRSAGDRHFLEIHLELDRSISFEESHGLVEELIAGLERSHPNLEVSVHSDPAARDPDDGTVLLPEPTNTDFR